MFSDEPIEPVKYPIDPNNSPEFPGKLPREFAEPRRDQLIKIMEEAGPYLGADHPALKALQAAADALMVVAFPKLNGYAEYTPEE
jgi:hypothetical protein